MNDTPPPSWRLFLALPLDPDTLRGIEAFRARNRTLQQPGFRWMAPQNLHLTVFFLGKVAVADLEALQAALAPVFDCAPSLSFQFEAFTVQPRRRPRMIWVGYRLNTDFNQLANAVADVCAPFLQESRQRFPEPVPHITVARFKKPPGEPDQAGLTLPVLPGSRVELWRSATDHRGVVYTSLAGWTLGALG